MIKRFLLIICLFCLPLNCYSAQDGVDNLVVPEFKPVELPPVQVVEEIKQTPVKEEKIIEFKAIEIPEPKKEIIKEKIEEKATKTIKKTKNKAKKINKKVKEVQKDTVKDLQELKNDILQPASTEVPKEEIIDKILETPTLQDISKDVPQQSVTGKNIFHEEDMEVIGKTFWGRKPIHPIAKYGYKGRLPDIELELEYKKTKDAYKSLIKTDDNATKKDLIPAPRDNKAYVDIVIKKASSSEYVNDVNDVIFILQKMIDNIEKDVNVQKFNAQVSSLLDNIFYIQDKYKDKPEGNYISLRKMLELAAIARDTAILRTEAQAYSKYLAYSGEGEVYRPERIQKQMDYLLSEILATLKILKAVN